MKWLATAYFLFMTAFANAAPSGSNVLFGGGNFSGFIASNPLLVGAAALILIVVALVMLRMKKSKRIKLAR